MTPERWRRIDDLFDAALRLDPAEREAWLRGACGDDDDLRAEVGRLLAPGRAGGPGRVPDAARGGGPATGPDGELAPPRRPPPPERAATTGQVEAVPAADTGGFSPKAAIAAGTGAAPSPRPRRWCGRGSRELPMIYILILGMALFWTHAVLGHDDPTLYTR